MIADVYVVRESAEKMKAFKETRFFFMAVGNEEMYFETLDEYTSVLKEKAGENLEFKHLRRM